MPDKVRFPSVLTDREWKKAEKKLKVSATGVGQTLRTLEKSAATLEKAFVPVLAGQVDAVKLKPLVAKHVLAIGEVRKAVIKAQSIVLAKKNDAAQDWLDRYADVLKIYYGVWDDFDPTREHDLEDGLERLDGNIDKHRFHNHLT